jgi:hypothetical protein
MAIKKQLTSMSTAKVSAPKAMPSAPRAVASNSMKVSAVKASPQIKSAGLDRKPIAPTPVKRVTSSNTSNMMGNTGTVKNVRTGTAVGSGVKRSDSSEAEPVRRR